MFVKLKKPRKFKVMNFETGDYKPVTIVPSRILEIEFIDKQAISNAKNDDSLYTFLTFNEGYYWIKTELFDQRKYCTDDSSPFLLTDDDFIEVNK